MSHSNSSWRSPCDRRRFLVGASLLGLGAIRPSVLSAHRPPDTWQLGQQTIRATASIGPADLDVFRIHQGHVWGSDLARVELDLLMPGGRVFAWTWGRESEGAGPIQMPIARGTEIELTVVLAEGQCRRDRLALDGQAGLFALSLTPGRPPVWHHDPDESLGRWTLPARPRGCAFLLEVSPDDPEHSQPLATESYNDV